MKKREDISPVVTGLYKYCISTIASGDKLSQFASRGWGELSEHSQWKTGKVLFQDASENGTSMPVIFSDAAYNTEDPLFWGTLRRVDVADRQTTFRFDDIKSIRGHRRQELVLRRTGQRIAPHYIRPYAICFTPDFLE